MPDSVTIAAPQLTDHPAALNVDEWLWAEFAGYPNHECPKCFYGPAMHDAELDRFGDPVPICVTENGDRRW